MIVVVNGSKIGYKEVSVSSSLNEITRQFHLEITEEKRTLKEGDSVKIFTKDKILLIDAVIEYIQNNGSFTNIYIGRNKARFLVDCYAEKTIQFKLGDNLRSVLGDICGIFNIAVSGDASMPKYDRQKIEIGNKYGDWAVRVAQKAGQVITSDAVGNIEITGEPIKTEYVYRYGWNIRNREYKLDTTTQYDRYVIVAQNGVKRKLGKGNIDISNTGEFGDGEFVKVIVLNETMTQEECKKRAKTEYIRDRRKSLSYTIEVDNNIDVAVNKKYQIIDEHLGISEYMRLKSFEALAGENVDRLILRFERIL